jgi:hypothetical protein
MQSEDRLVVLVVQHMPLDKRSDSPRMDSQSPAHHRAFARMCKVLSSQLVRPIDVKGVKKFRLAATGTTARYRRRDIIKQLPMPVLLEPKVHHVAEIVARKRQSTISSHPIPSQAHRLISIVTQDPRQNINLPPSLKPQSPPPP